MFEESERKGELCFSFNRAMRVSNALCYDCSHYYSISSKNLAPLIFVPFRYFSERVVRYVCYKWIACVHGRMLKFVSKYSAKHGIYCTEFLEDIWYFKDDTKKCGHLHKSCKLIAFH